MENDYRDPFADYKRTYYKKHPETALRWRLQAAINLLIKHGYSIKEPVKPEAAESEAAGDV